MLNKLLTPLLLLISSISFAQEAEIWACDEKNNTGFKWENYFWQVATFVEDNYLLRLDGTNSEFDGKPYACFKGYYFTKCGDLTGANDVTLNRSNGKATLTRVWGAVSDDDNISKDTVSISLMECTKFQP